MIEGVGVVVDGEGQEIIKGFGVYAQKNTHERHKGHRGEH